MLRRSALAPLLAMTPTFCHFERSEAISYKFPTRKNSRVPVAEFAKIRAARSNQIPEVLGQISSHGEFVATSFFMPYFQEEML